MPALLGLAFVLAMLGGGRLIWLLISTRRIIRRSREITTGTIRRELDRLLQASGRRITVRLAESAEIGIPAAGGLFRRVILLPEDAERRFQPDEVRALLAHELGHHVRGDVWWLWFGRAICVLLPVQPLHFLAVRRWQRSAEPLCDDWAIAQNICPLALARSLTRAAQWHLTRPAIGPAATEGASLLAHRVERLLNRRADPRPTIRRRWKLGLTLLPALVVIMFSPQILLPSETEDTDLTAEQSPIAEDHKTLPTSAGQQTNGRHSENAIPHDVLKDLETTKADLRAALDLLEAGEVDLESRQVADRLRHRLDGLETTLDQIQADDIRTGIRPESP